MPNPKQPADPRNRRAYRRHHVCLPGELLSADAPARICSVYDLGLHGVAATVTGRPSVAMPVPGTAVVLRLPIDGTRRAARVSGEVRWTAGDMQGQRFGLHFARCNETALNLLLKAGADLGPRVGARAASAVDASLAEMFPELGEPFLRWLFERGQELLLEDAEKADDDAACALLAHTAIELWNARGRLANSALQQVQTHLAQDTDLRARNVPVLPVWLLAGALDAACRQHFTDASHVQPASDALRRGLRESVSGDRLAPTQRSNPNEIVLSSQDLASGESAKVRTLRPARVAKG